MTQEHNTPADSTPTTSEEVIAQTEEDGPSPAPALNRAERRAQAKGKKGSGAALNPAVPHNTNLRGPGGRGHGPAGQTHFPRTGHK